MKGLRKVVPPSREILEDSGCPSIPARRSACSVPTARARSSLLRIMAGVDHEFPGRGVGRARGRSIGYLPQEPELDPKLDVRGNVELASRRSADCVERVQRDLDEVRRADERRRDGEAAERAGASCRSRSTSRPVEPRQQDRDGDGRAALPARRCGRDDALGRREAPRGAVPHAAGRARHAAARRTDEPPRRRERWRGWSITSSDSRAPWWPSPTIATSWTTWRSGSSSSIAARACRTRATTPAGWSRSSSVSRWKRKRRRARQKTLAARAGVGAHVAARATGEEQGAHLAATRSWRAKRSRIARCRTKSSSRPRRASATMW